MNEILTNGTEIKQRIITEIQKANKNNYFAMAFFTDRDIANAMIVAENRNLTVDIILSSNAQNDSIINKENILVFNHPSYNHFFSEWDKFKNTYEFDSSIELLKQIGTINSQIINCLLYTSDAADE